MLTYEDIETEFLEDYDKELNSLTAIKTDVEANDFIGKLKENKAMKEELTQRAKEIVENAKYKVDLWLQRKLEAIQADDERIMEMLKAYFEANEDVASGKKTKLQFPNGNLGIYTTQKEGYNWDDEKALLAFMVKARQEDPFAFHGLLKTELKLDKTAIKSNIELKDGKPYLCGVELPYVTHVEKTTGVAVK